LTPEEVWSLIDHAPAGRDRVLLEVLYTCGVRRAEAVGLRWCDLQPRPEAGQLSVFGKGGKSRAVLAPVALWDDLLLLRGAATADEPVFASRRRALVGTESALKRRVARPLDLSMINLIVARSALAAGLGKKVSPRWMRHYLRRHAAPLRLAFRSFGPQLFRNLSLSRRYHAISAQVFQ
jgi:integrase/recombinase XerD